MFAVPLCVCVYKVEKQCSEKRNIDFSAYKILWIKLPREPTVQLLISISALKFGHPGPMTSSTWPPIHRLFYGSIDFTPATASQFVNIPCKRSDPSPPLFHSENDFSVARVRKNFFRHLSRLANEKSTNQSWKHDFKYQCQLDEALITLHCTQS